MMCFFFFKQKTAYEMRISDWSSDVCSSDLGILVGGYQAGPFLSEIPRRERVIGSRGARPSRRSNQRGSACRIAVADRTSGENRRNTRAGGLQSEIGRASCRERVCQYVWISVCAGQLKKKREKRQDKN